MSVPHNIEAEQALFGALFVNNDCFDIISDILEPDHYFDPLHARIYQSIVDMAKGGKAISPVLLMSHFHDDEDLEVVGGSAYLARLMAHATTVKNVLSYGRDHNRTLSTQADLFDHLRRC